MRRLSALMAIGLVAAACTGDSTPDTTTAAAPSTTAAPTTTLPPTTTTTTEPPIPNGPAIVGDGDRNEIVAAVQFLLNCNGYGPLTVDGVYGPNTRSEIELLQGDLGREVTGGLDEESFAGMARNCDETRRVSFDEDATQGLVVGNTAPSDPDSYFVRVEEEAPLMITIVSVTGEARVSVQGSDGSVFDEPTGTAWAAEVPSTQDYIIEVTTTGDATRYEMTVSIPVLDDPDDIAAAEDGTVEVDDLEEAVSAVCRDITGEDAYVAETESGHLVVGAGTAGIHAIELGGIGAPVEFIFKDGSTGYHGFSDDLDVEVGEEVVGTARVFPSQRGSHEEPVELAFDFATSVTPCSGDVATSVVLGSEGLGILDLGDTNVEAAILTAQDALPGSSPPTDTGWVGFDPQANPYGICRESLTEARVVRIDNLSLFFADGTTSFASAGNRHFVGWSATVGLFPFVTASGVGPGSTIAQVLAAHPDATVVFDGGARVYIASAPGSDAWLLGEAPAAESADDRTAVVETFHGGRFCDR